MLSPPPARRILPLDRPFHSPRRTEGETLVPVPLQSSDSSRLYGFPQEKPPALPELVPFNFYNLSQ